MKKLLFCCLMVLTTVLSSGNNIYVDCNNGNDRSSGSRDYPFRTIQRASEYVNALEGDGEVTVFLAPGLYNLDEPVLFSSKRSFTNQQRLTIRATILPDDAQWDHALMPVIMSTAPLLADKFGEVSLGLQIETSHVTIQGMKFLGRPLHEFISPEKIRRYYPIVRRGLSLSDLVITQCMFIADPHVVPQHVSVLANGHSVVVDHCVFRNCKIPVVFWNAEGGTSRENAMTHCLVLGSYGCGIWTCDTGEDFVFSHNIVSGSAYCWIREKDSQKKYTVENSIFTENTRTAGYGAGPLLDFEETPSNFLQFGENVVTSGHIQIETDQEARTYLHVKPDTLGSSLGAGLFKKK